MIEAKIIADSVNEFGNRITSFVLVFPRIVLAEFNTHRMISRNSASSRAIPFKKMLEMVEQNPFVPIAWQKDHSGMQGNEYFDSVADLSRLKQDWLNARDHAVDIAKSLSDRGLTKQLCNRLLEPFMYHTVIATGTEWENFFALRAHPAAEIHIAKLADLMLQAMNESEPKQLKAGEWHIPFGDKIDETKLVDWDIVYHGSPTERQLQQYQVEINKLQIATARCARVSYNNFEGNDDYAADIKLHDRLASMGHWSPFEHCARAMSDKEYSFDASMNEKHPVDAGWSGNFRGFVQYRKTFTGENKSEVRLKRWKLR